MWDEWYKSFGAEWRNVMWGTVPGRNKNRNMWMRQRSVPNGILCISAMKNFLILRHIYCFDRVTMKRIITISFLAWSRRCKWHHLNARMNENHLFPLQESVRIGFSQYEMLLMRYFLFTTNIRFTSFALLNSVYFSFAVFIHLLTLAVIASSCDYPSLLFTRKKVHFP